MSLVLPGSYLAEQSLYPSLSYLGILRAVEHGLTGYEPCILQSVGMLRQSVRSELVACVPQLWNELALAICNKFNLRGGLRARVLVTSALWLQHWTADARVLIEQSAAQGLQEALAGGDMFMALYYHIANLGVGVDFRSLPEQQIEIQRARESISRLGNDLFISSLCTGHQLAIEALTAQTVAASDLTVREEAFISGAGANFPLAGSSYMVGRARTLLMLSEHRMALEMLARVQDKLSSIGG